MIYIFEGLNKVGKTTLVNEFSKRYGVPYMNIPRPNNGIEALRDPILVFGIYKNLCQNFILDRFYPSEYVYHKDYILKDFDYFEDMFKNISKIIYLSSTLKLIQSRGGVKGSLSYEELNERYENYLQYTKLPVLRLFSEEGIFYPKEEILDDKIE